MYKSKSSAYNASLCSTPIRVIPRNEVGILTATESNGKKQGRKWTAPRAELKYSYLVFLMFTVFQNSEKVFPLNSIKGFFSIQRDDRELRRVFGIDNIKQGSIIVSGMTMTIVTFSVPVLLLAYWALLLSTVTTVRLVCSGTGFIFAFTSLCVVNNLVSGGG